MNMKYVTQIQGNLKRFEKLISSKTTTRILDGSYRSIYKGRSMNFDELREYAAGDNIKDIDWNASARAGRLFIRQYVAEKKHNVMFVFDTNVSMLADSQGLEDKSNLAIMSAGTLAYMVDRTGDYVSGIYATDDSVRLFPFATGLGNIEIILEKYHREVSKGNKTDISNAVDYIVRHFRQKMIVVLVTDSLGLESLSDTELKRLQVANDVLVLHISDADFTIGDMFDVQKKGRIESFFSRDKKLMAAVQAEKEARYQREMDRLENLGISVSTIDYLDELDKEMMSLLEKHKVGVTTYGCNV